MENRNKSIPEAPPLEDFKTYQKQHSEIKYPHPIIKSPIKRHISETFHEGHEEFIPNPEDRIDHDKFERNKEILDEHFGAPIHSNQKMAQATSENQGLWEKTKATLSLGVDKIKKIFKS